MAGEPQIPLLPPAPQRVQGQTNYPIIADTWAAAIGPWTVKVNESTLYINEKAVSANTSVVAAAESASAAADSASSAATVGGQAVAAAQAARDAAAASALSAQASAQAAGDAAGFPDFVDGLDVLQVNETKTGVKWGKVGQSVGDTLITNRPAPAGYVEAGGIYSQAAYPELFALLGIKEANNDGVNWGAYTTTPGASVDYMVSGKDDVIICIANTAGGSSTGGRAYRSTDSGATWVSVAGLLGKETLGTLACDIFGNWIVTTVTNQPYIYTSNDNGLTWTQRAKPGGTSYQITSIASGQPGVFVMAVFSSAPATLLYRSADYGATWTLGVQYPYPPGSPVVTDGAGFWSICLQIGPYPAALQSYDNFATAISNSSWYPAAGGGGVVMGSVNNSIVVISNFGLTSRHLNYIPIAHPFIDKSGVLYAFAYGVTGLTTTAFKSYDQGYSWTKLALTIGIGSLPTASTVVLSNGTWISCYNGAWRKSTRLYNYDTATQFKVPVIKTPKGLKAYVKAKAA